MLGHKRVVSAVALLALVGACASDPPPRVLSYDEWKAQNSARSQAQDAPLPAAVTVAATPPRTMRLPLTSGGGTPHVEVGIAGVCCFSFTVDSGAADVSVSARLFVAMHKSGHITEEDAIDVVKYRTANGVIEGLRFRMPPMQIGGRTVTGVVGSVSKGSDMLLLGQSFLTKFRFWAIDNSSGELVLGL